MNRNKEADLRKLADAFYDELEIDDYFCGLDAKRPFGNSMIGGDIAEIIEPELDTNDLDDDEYEELMEYCEDLYYEDLLPYLKKKWNVFKRLVLDNPKVFTGKAAKKKREEMNRERTEEEKREHQERMKKFRNMANVFRTDVEVEKDDLKRLYNLFVKASEIFGPPNMDDIDQFEAILESYNIDLDKTNINGLFELEG